MKWKVNKTVLRPAMVYCLEKVSLTKRQEVELEVAEMKMFKFCWPCAGLRELSMLEGQLGVSSLELERQS